MLGPRTISTPGALRWREGPDDHAVVHEEALGAAAEPAADPVLRLEVEPARDAAEDGRGGRGLGAHEVDLRVGRARAALEVAVGAAQGHRAARGRLAVADAEGAGRLHEPCARRDDVGEVAVLFDVDEHLPRAGRHDEADVGRQLAPRAA